MRLHDLLADIHALEATLLAFERTYGVRSETCYAAYRIGEEPEHDEWVLDVGEWASVYQTWLTRQAEYRNEVQRMRSIMSVEETPRAHRPSVRRLRQAEGVLPWLA